MDRVARAVAVGRPEPAVFAVLWAFAALLHVVGNPEFSSPATTTALAVAIALVLLAPGRAWSMAPLAIAQLATVWSEAPFLGNHWLLAGAVNLSVLIALAVSRFDDERFWSALLPAARWCLVGFYAFAAFAKINSGFLTVDVSCAPHYLRESADSIGLDALASPSRAIEQVSMWATLLVECSVPLLLVLRRTRHLWVPIAMAFHLVLALDRTHQFYDFSSVLLALFLLFLPAAFSEAVLDRFDVARLVALRLAAAGIATYVTLSGGLGWASSRTSRLSYGWPVWQAAAVLTLVAVVVWLVRVRPPAPPAGALRLSPALVLVAVLVVANGLTPYLELKTAYGWNMYANLRTVGGETNHLLVPRTFPLVDEQEDLIEIVESDDRRLAAYARRHLAITERTLRGYLHDHPDTALTIRRDGKEERIERAGDHPDLVRAVPEWQRKLFLHRSVRTDIDPDEPPCQDSFPPLG